MDFNIPKIKRVETKDNLRNVALKGRDSQDVLDIAQRSFLDRNFKTGWEVTAVHLVENKTLEEAYRTKKIEMKEDGRHARELTEQYAYLNMKDQKISQKVAQDGLKTRELSCNSLGNSKQGIYLCKHADVQLRLFDMSAQDSCQLMVFKIVLGRSKVMSVQPTMSVDPTPNYDCHISQLKPSPTDLLSLQVTRSHLYLYEYDDDTCEPVQRPRQCLPYAVITYRKSKEVAQNTSGGMSYSYNRPAKPLEVKEASDIHGLGSRSKTDTSMIKGATRRPLTKQERRELFERQHADALRRQALQEARPIEANTDPAKIYVANTAFTKTQTRHDPRVKHAPPFIPPQPASIGSQKSVVQGVDPRRLSQEKQTHGMRYQKQLSVNIPRQRRFSGSTGSPSPDGDTSISDALTDLIVKNQIRVDASGRPVLPPTVRTEEERVQSINQKFADEIQKHLQMTGVVDLPRQPLSVSSEKCQEQLVEDYTPQPMEIEPMEIEPMETESTGSYDNIEKGDELEFDSKISELLNQASMKPMDNLCISESSSSGQVNVQSELGKLGTDIKKNAVDGNKKKMVEMSSTETSTKKPEIEDEEDDDDDKLVIADLDIESKKAEEVEKLRKIKESSLERDLLTYVSRDDIKKKDTDKSETDENESRNTEEPINIVVVKEETMNKNEQLKMRREKILKEVQHLLEKSKEKSFDSDTDSSKDNNASSPSTGEKQISESKQRQQEPSPVKMPLPMPHTSEYEFESRFSSDSEAESDDGRYEHQSTPVYHRPVSRPNFHETPEKVDPRGPYDVQTNPQIVQSKSDTWVQKDLFNAYSDNNVPPSRPLPHGHNQWPQQQLPQGYPSQSLDHPQHNQGHQPYMPSHMNQQPHPHQAPPPQQNMQYPPQVQNPPNPGAPPPPGPVLNSPFEPHLYPPRSDGGGYPSSFPAQSRSDSDVRYQNQSQHSGPPYVQDQDYRRRPTPMDFLHVQNLDHRQQALIDVNPETGDVDYRRLNPVKPIQNQSQMAEQFPQSGRQAPYLPSLNIPPPMLNQNNGPPGPNQQGMLNPNMLSPTGAGANWGKSDTIGHTSPSKDKKISYKDYKARRKNSPIRGEGSQGSFENALQTADLDVSNLKNILETVNVVSALSHDFAEGEEPTQYIDDITKGSSQPPIKHTGKLAFLNDVKDDEGLFNCYGGEKIPGIGDLAPQAITTEKISLSSILGTKIDMKKFEDTDLRQEQDRPEILDAQGNPIEVNKNVSPAPAAAPSPVKMSPPSRGSSPRGRKKTKVKKDMMGYVKRKRRRRNKNLGDNSSDKTGETGSVTSSDWRSVDDLAKGRVMSLEEVGLNHWTDAISHPSFQPRVVLKREKAAEAGAARIAEDNGLKCLDEALESQPDHKQTRIRQWVETSHKKIKLITLKRTKDDDTESVKSGKSSILDDIIDIDGLVEKQIAQDMAKSDEAISISSSEIQVIHQKPGPKCSKKLVPQSIEVLQQRKPVHVASSTTVQSSTISQPQSFQVTPSSQSKPVGTNPPYPLTPNYSVPPPGVIPPYPPGGHQQRPPYPVNSPLPPPQGVPVGIHGSTPPIVSPSQGQRFQYPPPPVRSSFSQHLLENLDFSKPPPNIPPKPVPPPANAVAHVSTSSSALPVSGLPLIQQPPLNSSQNLQPTPAPKLQQRLPTPQIRPIVAQAAFLAGPASRFQLYPPSSDSQTVPSSTDVTPVTAAANIELSGNKRPSDLADWFADKLNPKAADATIDASNASQTDSGSIKPKQGTLFEELEKVKKNKLESKEPFVVKRKSRSRSRERPQKKKKNETNDIFDDSVTESTFSRSSRSPSSLASSRKRSPDSKHRRPYDSPVYRRRSFSPRRRRSYSRSWSRSRSRSGSRSTSRSKRSRSRSRRRTRSRSRSPFRRSGSRSRTRFRRSRSSSRSRFRRSRSLSRSRYKRFKSRSSSRQRFRRSRSRSRSSSRPRRARTRSRSKSPRRSFPRRSRSKSIEKRRSSRGHSASDVKTTDFQKFLPKSTKSISSPSEKKKPDFTRKISPDKKGRRTPEAYRIRKKSKSPFTGKEISQEGSPKLKDTTVIDKATSKDKTTIAKVSSADLRKSNTYLLKEDKSREVKTSLPKESTKASLPKQSVDKDTPSEEKNVEAPNEASQKQVENPVQIVIDVSPEPLCRPFLKGPLQIAAESKWTKSNFTEYTVDQIKEEDLKLQEELRKLEEQKKLLEEQDQKIQEEMRIKEDKRIRDELKELERQKKFAEELLELQKQKELAEELAELEKQKRLAEELIELERQRKIAEELVELESKNKTAEEMEELNKRKKELEEEISKPSTIETLGDGVDQKISDELDELAHQKEALQKALEALEYGEIDSEGLEDGEIEDDSEEGEVDEESSNRSKGKSGSFIDLTGESPKKRSGSKGERTPSKERKRKRSYSKERKSDSSRDKKQSSTQERRRSRSRERVHRQRHSSIDDYYDDYDYGYEYNSNTREGRRSHGEPKRNHAKEIGNMWGDMIATKDSRVERVRGDPEVESGVQTKKKLEPDVEDDYDEDEEVRKYLQGNKPKSLAAKIRCNELITAYDLDAELKRSNTKNTSRQELVTFSDWLKMEYKIEDDLEVAKYKKYISCVDIYTRIDEHSKNRRKTLKKRLRAEMVTAQELLKKEEQEKQSKKNQGATGHKVVESEVKEKIEIGKDGEEHLVCDDGVKMSWEIERLSQPFTVQKQTLISELDMIRSALKMSWKEKPLDSMKEKTADGDYDNEFLMRHDLQQLEAEILMRISHFEFYGVPNRRVPEALLTMKEKISHFSEEGLFLVMTASISHKAYQNLLSLKKKIESLEENVNKLDPDLHLYQLTTNLAEMESLHQSRKAVMLTIAGYLTKKRFSKLSTRVKYYKRCIQYIHDLWKKESIYLNTTVSDAEVHLKLGERLLHEQEDAKKKGIFVNPATLTGSLKQESIKSSPSSTLVNIQCNDNINNSKMMSSAPASGGKSESRAASSFSVENKPNQNTNSRPSLQSYTGGNFLRSVPQGASYSYGGGKYEKNTSGGGSAGGYSPRESTSYSSSSRDVKDDRVSGYPSNSSSKDQRSSTSYPSSYSSKDNRSSTTYTSNRTSVKDSKGSTSYLSSTNIQDQRTLTSYSSGKVNNEKCASSSYTGSSQRPIQPDPPVHQHEQLSRTDLKNVETQGKYIPSHTSSSSSRNSAVVSQSSAPGQSGNLRQINISSNSTLAQGYKYGSQKQDTSEKPGHSGTYPVQPLLKRQDSDDKPFSSNSSTSVSSSSGSQQAGLKGQSSTSITERKVQYNPSYKRVDGGDRLGDEAIKSPYTLPPARYLQQSSQRGPQSSSVGAPKDQSKSQTDKKLESDLMTVKNKLLNLSQQLRHDDSVRMSVQSVLLSVTEALNLLREKSSNLPKVKEIILECLARYNAVKELMEG